MTTNAQPASDAQTTRLLIADNVSAEMKRARWTGRAAAQALGLTQPYVHRRTSGEIEFSGSDLALFAGFLNVPVETFFATRPTADVHELDTTRNAKDRTTDYRSEGSVATVTDMASRRTAGAPPVRVIPGGRPVSVLSDRGRTGKAESPATLGVRA